MATFTGLQFYKYIFSLVLLFSYCLITLAKISVLAWTADINRHSALVNLKLQICAVHQIAQQVVTSYQISLEFKW